MIDHTNYTNLLNFFSFYGIRLQIYDSINFCAELGKLKVRVSRVRISVLFRVRYLMQRPIVDYRSMGE